MEDHRICKTKLLGEDCGLVGEDACVTDEEGLRAGVVTIIDTTLEVLVVNV